jgi:hypothetical protein
VTNRWPRSLFVDAIYPAVLRRRVRVGKISFTKRMHKTLPGRDANDTTKEKAPADKSTEAFVESNVTATNAGIWREC